MRNYELNFNKCDPIYCCRLNTENKKYKNKILNSIQVMHDLSKRMMKENKSSSNEEMKMSHPNL